MEALSVEELVPVSFMESSNSGGVVPVFSMKSAPRRVVLYSEELLDALERRG